MTEAAGERFAGMTVEDARREVVAALREDDCISGTQPYEHDVPHSHRSGRRIEPLISLQWFCDMRAAGRPGHRGGARRHACASTPRSRGPASTWTGWRTSGPGASRASCGGATRSRSGTAARSVHVGSEPPEGEGWERDPDVLDTWFSSGLWPFATLGWPEQTAELRAFYPTDVLSTARDIIFLWVARMVMFGIEFTGARAVHRRADPLDDPGPRRAADVQVARHRHRPARRDRRARRRRACASACWRCPRPRTCASRPAARAAGPRPGQQAVERLAADPAGRGPEARADAGRRRDRRGPLDRLAAGAPDREHRAADRAFELSRGDAGALRLRSGPSCATGTSSWPSRGCTPTATRRSRPCCSTRSSAASRLLHPRCRS